MTRRRVHATAIGIALTAGVVFVGDTAIPVPIGIPTLVSACRESPSRTIEARPSGGFAHRPLEERPPYWRVIDAVDVVNQKSTDPRARALAFLFVGDANQAIGGLEEDLRRRPHNADSWCDLSAAYLTRGREHRFAPDYALALNAAEEAWRLRQTSEIAWNRALALTAFHLPAAARVAWDDAIRLERDDAWREEAEKRRAALDIATEADAWRAVEPQLQEPNAAKAAGLRFPARAYSYFETSILPRWNQRDRGAMIGRQLAAVLAEQGERFPLETIAAIDKACRAAAECESMIRAHAQIAHAESLLRDQKIRQASVEFAAAAAALGDSPYRLYAECRRGACMLHENQYREAAVLGREILAAVRNRHYRALEGRTLWLLGLATLHDARPEESIAYYKEARRLFVEAHDTANTGALDLLLADAYEYAGDRDTAMKHRVDALDAMRRSGDSTQLHQALFEGGTSLASQGLDAAADALLAQAVDESMRRKRAIIAAVSSMWRSLIASRRRDLDGAGEQARRATFFWSQTTDPGQRALLAATTNQLDRPSRAKLTDAITFFQQAGNRAWLPELLRQRAQTLEREGDVAGAGADYRRAIAITEDELGDAGSASIRDGLASNTRANYEDVIRLLLAHNETGPALVFAERARRIGRRSSGDTHLSVPAGAFAAVLEIQGDRLVTWLVAHDRTQFFDHRLPADLDGALEDPESHLSRLYDVLVGNWITAVPKESALFILPPPTLQGVPFSALRNAQTNRAVVDDYAVTIAPDLASTEEGAPDVESSAPILVVGDPAYAQAPHLPASATEAKTVASLYQHATLLTDQQANGAAVLEHIRSAEVFHLGTHAVANELVPELSSIVLAARNGQDTHLYVRELLERRWPLKLVVLSACSTARSRAGQRGSLTIARAFLEGGTRAAIATYWPVTDPAAASFSTELHRQLVRGETVAGAVRAAQLHVRSRMPRDPSWAAFCVLLGNAEDKGGKGR